MQGGGARGEGCYQKGTGNVQGFSDGEADRMK